MSATSEMVWWGERNGRVEMSVAPLSNFPAMECICVVSKLSASVSGGRIEGKRFAIILLPSLDCPQATDYVRRQLPLQKRASRQVGLSPH